MLSLLSRTKSFRDPWVGQPALNQRWQLHRRRVQLAEALCRWRRWLRPVQERQLERDGFCLLYTSDAADDMQCVDLGGRRIIKRTK